MKLHIGNHLFSIDEIQGLRITEREVLIDGVDDFYRIKYSTQEEIHDALLYKKLQELTYNDMYDAVRTLVCICDVFINSKEQCVECPLHKSYGCMLQTLPINWI